MTTPTDALIVDLKIENHYPDSVSVTHANRVTVPAPEEYTADALPDWAMDHLFAFTGTGRRDGNSFYVVTVTAASDPRMSGRTFEIG